MTDDGIGKEAAPLPGLIEHATQGDIRFSERFIARPLFICESSQADSRYFAIDAAIEFTLTGRTSGHELKTKTNILRREK